jgi:hypothetical protein
MNTLNFKINENKEDIVKYLQEEGYKKIGHIKKDAVGFCIMIDRKQFFEISNMLNPNIAQTSNFSDLVFYCNITKKCNHKQNKLGYIQWNEWAENKIKKGETQRQCPLCKLWLFEEEF